MEAFTRGFIAGVKDAPKIFFAPVIAIWLLLVSTTDSLLNKKQL